MRYSQRSALQLLNYAHEQGELLVEPSPSALRTLTNLKKRELCFSPQQGMYARTVWWNSLSPSEQLKVVVQARAKMNPHLVFCRYSAALMHDIDVPWSLCHNLWILGTHSPVQTPFPTKCEFYKPPSSKAKHQTPPVEVVTREGIQLTSLADTLVSCLKDAPFELGMVIADSFLRHGCLSKEEMIKIANTRTNKKKGAAQVREVCAMATGGTENGGESLVRARILALGFENPELQVWIADPLDPSMKYRVDFLWQNAYGGAVVGELDGRIKYEDKRFMSVPLAEEVRQKERRREARITAVGYRVMRFSLDETANPYHFTRMLEMYGIPRAQP